MMQLLRAYTERANASAQRVAETVSGGVNAALVNLGNVIDRSAFGTSFNAMTATTGTTTVFGNITAWNAMPSVHATAICTHGKRYERRLQEMLT